MAAAIPTSSPRYRSSTVALLAFLHQSTSVLAGLGLIGLIWFWHPRQTPPMTPDAAAAHVFWVAIATLIYLAVQAVATLSHPVGSERRVLVDMVLSSFPLLVIIYALVDWARGSLALNVFQTMTVSLWGLATLIDVIIFSLFALRIIRRTSELNIGGGG